MEKNIQYRELQYVREKAQEFECEVTGVYLPDWNTVVVSTYRSPSGNVNTFLKILEETLIDIIRNNKQDAKSLSRETTT